MDGLTMQKGRPSPSCIKTYSASALVKVYVLGRFPMILVVIDVIISSLIHLEEKKLEEKCKLKQ